QRATLTWRGLYRGRRLDQPVTVSLHPVAELTRTVHPPTPGAAVSVRVDTGLVDRYGVAQGALAVVLDCSGSMGPGAGRARTESTRYRQVTRALRRLLARVPRGTSVSVWTFGEASPPGNTVADAERTIRRVIAPVLWRRTEQQINELADRLDGLTPWNESPIVRAILRAREDVAQAQGFRTIVVLTDGIDNRWAKDKAANPGGTSVAQAIEKGFKGSGIGLHVVGFQVEGPLEREAHKQFAVVRKLGGTFTTVSRLDALVRVLEGVMRPSLRYRLVGGRGEFTTTPIDASLPGENDRWVAVPSREVGPLDLQVTTGWDLKQK